MTKNAKKRIARKAAAASARKFDISKVKHVSENDTIIHEYNGTSVRKWAQSVRDMGITELPELYLYLETVPVRSKDGTRVIIEGKYAIGCNWKGKPISFKRFCAGTGYKLPCSGTREKCLELIRDYTCALNMSGKYANKGK